MIIAEAGHFILSDRWPSWLLVAGVAAGAVGWVMLYRFGRRMGAAGPEVGKGAGLLHGARGVITAVLRIGLAFGGVWLAFGVLGRICLLATDWSLWPMALGGVLAAEALIWLYGLERRIVTRKAGMLLISLRLALLGLVILMLLQPVFASAWGRTTKRTLVVLLDESTSMRIADEANLAAHERLRLAEHFSVPAARRPWRLEENAENLRSIRDEVLGELARLDGLARAKKDAMSKQLSDRRKTLHEKVTAWVETVGEQIDAIEKIRGDQSGIAQNLRAEILDAKAVLSRQVRRQLLNAAGLTHEERAGELAGNFENLRKALRQSAAGLGKAQPALDRAAAALDGLLYKHLSGDDRAAVDAVAKLTRMELAVAALVHKPANPGDDKAGDKSLIEYLTDQYNVKVYTFASDLTEADPGDWTDPVAGADAGGSDRSLSASRPTGSPDAERLGRTDLAAALRKVTAEAAEDDLAGVLVLTDGQDNSKTNMEPLARAMGGSGAALSAVVIGGSKPPADAAIISIESPETVYLEDKMFINAELKLDGLKGKTVGVKLLRGKKQVDSRKIRIAGDVFRTRIQLADKPDKIGLHDYRIEIDRCEGEVFTGNNSYALTLSVTDDKTKVLLIDSRSRWEFRYLKNLFSGRDKSVRLQYVLTEPDKFTGQPARKVIPASVKRPAADAEATALPENEQEWMKFDVIIIGDVPAGAFSAEAAGSIRKFVTDRGGTVVFIAGPRFMPGNFVGTDFAELIPVRLGRQDKPLPIPKQGFRIAPTPAGSAHVIGRQDVEADKSLKIWQSFPPVYWRSRFTQASASGTVLACAMDPDAPTWMTGGAGLKPVPLKLGPASTPQSLAKRREEYRRSRALITIAPCGLGKVMMLGFDRTWRMRYRKGDVHHHKFWGQVIRWATAGELPAGTHLVKLGTDASRYPPHSRVIVRARLVREDFSPVVTDQLAVKVFRRKKCVARAAMKYVKDSPGMYTARLAELPAGSYRLELEGPIVAELLARDGVDKVATNISVDPSSPTEQIELASNRDLLVRLAALSHNGAIVGPHQARRILSSLPVGKVTKKHRRQYLLWDSWPLLALFCAVAAAEWIIRKRVGLT